jgi:hypothetical protein
MHCCFVSRLGGSGDRVLTSDVDEPQVSKRWLDGGSRNNGDRHQVQRMGELRLHVMAITIEHGLPIEY